MAEDTEEYNPDKPKVVSQEISIAGDKENCNICKEADAFFAKNSVETGVKYTYNPMESSEGKRISSEVDANDKGNIPIPVIEYCKTVKEGEDAPPEKLCDYVTGFNKSDWDSKLNYKRQNEVDDEIDEIFGDDE